MTTTTTTVTIGDATITLDSAELTCAVREEGGLFLSGTAYVTVLHRDDAQHLACPVGCWADTDDDQAEWCAANEGARIIEQCITGREAAGDTRGSFVRLAFAAACAELGAAACELLRDWQYGDLYDYDTAEYIREATLEEVLASAAAASGVILVNEDGDIVTADSYGAEDARSVYVQRY